MDKRFNDAPSEEFLAELLERAKRYGWDGDYTEVANFVESLYMKAGVTLIQDELEPY